MQTHCPFITELRLSLQVRHSVSREHEAHSDLQQPCPKDVQEHAVSYFEEVEVSMHEHVVLDVNSQLLLGQLHLIPFEPLQPNPDGQIIPEESVEVLTEVGPHPVPISGKIKLGLQLEQDPIKQFELLVELKCLLGTLASL